MVEVYCAWCKKPFLKSSHEIKRTQHNLCSRSCSASFGKWKGGNSYTYQAKQYLPIAITIEQKCSMCGSVNKLIVHHIDFD